MLWFTIKILKEHPIRHNWRDFTVNLLIKGVVIFVIPAGIAIVISESISAVYVRQRPFVALSGVKLLVPHGVDGGMPSHHMVFMATLIATVYFYNRKFAALLALLAFLTGIARVVAGIHYPTDIMVGAVLGVAVAYLYRWASVKFVNDRYLALD